MKTLIADCGATKCEWLADDGTSLVTRGVNLAHMQEEDARSLIDAAAARFGTDVGHIYFYAAGLVGLPPLDLKRWFPGAQVEYASDLVGAARALCGKENGVVAIVGTGASTCQYDGRRIVKKVPSGGYILGDEGSAAVLGRLFLADYLKGCVPEEMAAEFREQYPATYPEIVQEVYGTPAPARFLGSIAPFLIEHYPHPYAKELVDRNFRNLFERTLSRYDALPVGVTGGFGYACRDILTSIGQEYGVTFRAFQPTPMEGLKAYHGL